MRPGVAVGALVAFSLAVACSNRQPPGGPLPGEPSPPNGPAETQTEPVPPIAEAVPQPEPPDIFAVMRDAGFSLESEEDFADYLPVPPRSRGQVGRFQSDEGGVVVARVTYLASELADPHDVLIRERLAVLGDDHERLVRIGATIIHIRADTRDAADRAEAAFRRDATR